AARAGRVGRRTGTLRRRRFPGADGCGGPDQRFLAVRCGHGRGQASSRLRREYRERRVPLSEKAIVCACEDVSVHDVDDAIAHGYADIESLKRYTGLGTGPCQGKSCEVGAMRTCAQRNAVPPEARVPFRARPPQAPTQLSAYAGLPAEITGERIPQPGLKPTWGAGPHPLQPREPLPAGVDVAIIGGGIMGLALAWNLAGRGAGKVLVLERGYLCEGASGRNGGGVRATWGTPLLIELAKESIAFMGHFAQE